jgi:hypothetical protein
MELNQLEYFVALAHIKNFTKAAKSLNVSQPALSRSISRLEKDLNIPLFIRDSRKVNLTQYGQTFLTYAERILQELETARQDITNMAEPDSGVVNLSFMHSLGVYLVPELLKEFRKIYPKIQFRLSQNHSFLLSKQLFKGESDLCLCSSPINSEDIAWVPLLTEELFIIVPSTHPLAHRSSINITEVASEAFITLKPMYGLRTKTEHIFEVASIRPKIRFEGDEIVTVASLVAANLGVSLVPKIPGMEHLDIKFISVDNPKCTRDIGLAWYANKPLSLAAHRFQNFIIDKFNHE